MDTLRRTIEQISQQLGQLTTSQKVAIGLCAVIVAGSLAWLVQYSSEPDRVALLAQDMAVDHLDEALQALRGQGIDAKQMGNRIYVRPDERSSAMMILSRAELLPQDTSVGFTELMADDDPFRSSSENEWRRQVALGTELGRIIGSGPDIESARVMIQDKSKRRLGAMGAIKPTASVYVTTARGRVLDSPAVEAMCRLVAGAVPGLEPQNVVVIDGQTMQPFSIPSEEEMLSRGQLEERKRNEQHLRSKLMEVLQSIPGVLVSVSVQLDPSKTVSEKRSYTKVEPKMEDTTDESSNSGGGPGETGVNPNVGVALGGETGGTSHEASSSKTEFFPPNPSEVTQTETPPFRVERATASIGVPRSFLVGIFRAKGGSEPENGAVDELPGFVTIRDSELARIRNQAMKVLMTENSNDVDVDVFYDLAEDGATLKSNPLVDVQIASTDTGATGFLRRYGVQLVLGVLALLSFLLMTRMVRRSTNVVDALLPAERKKTQLDDAEEILDVAAGPVGKASLSEGILVGHEVDEDTLRISQLGEQVRSVIQDDASSAAELIRRWAEASD